ncbi:hypothetical protein [[Clostridium] polysaccharolyticum]|uniref:Uncharacterized protein n=1 Tax=[Clostridium] polysaccharolyticum TaxID=29364 RepID=A0A1I0FGG3_9FIRM|nr:hypothetical protein [[Clostridium] polysaccharolyticum]SET56613.1 hypothetical protein SAMN04487772_13111 [[Clostridium] polysaccharolyticum]
MKSLSSVFKKLITKELGASRYNKYFFCYQKLIIEKKYDSTKLSNKEIHDDIYNILKDRDIATLQKMLERLLDCMHLALSISKQYLFVLIAYILTIIIILSQGFLWWISLGSIAVLTISFLYKTFEFVVNKYCFIDAHIILVYKSVLDELILMRVRQQTE